MKPLLPAVVIAVAVVASANCAGTPTQSTAVPTPDSRLTMLTGRVQDSVFRPLRDARVEVLDGALMGAVATTNNEGRFVVAPPVPAGQSVTLHVTKEGYSTATPKIRTDTNLLVTLTSSTLIGLEGEYTVTFSASPACGQLPAAVQRRTYTGVVRPRPSPPRAHFLAELAGADLYAAYDTFSAVVGDDAARFSIFSREAFDWWLEDHPIVERMAPNAYVAFMGTAMASQVTSNLSISATFDGTVAYCPAATAPTVENYPPSCTAPIECRASDHQVVFSRR